MLLAIETSSLVSSVALLHEDTLRAELTIQARLTHSEQLMPHIADMLEKASVAKSQIDSVAVSVGPGSFTGLRIGLATAKGLAYAWNVPIVGVSTMEGLAWNQAGSSDLICPLIDAQKGNVYAGLYEWNRAKLMEREAVRIVPLAAVLEELNLEGRPVTFAGDGALLGRKAIVEKSTLFRMAPPTMVIPRAGSIALAGLAKLISGNQDDCMTLTPAYKRRSEAEILWEKRYGKTPL